MNICFGMQANKTDNDDLNTQILALNYEAAIYLALKIETQICNVNLVCSSVTR